MDTGPQTILLIEDNPDHAELVKRCLELQSSIGSITHVSNGAEALDYLFRRGGYTDPGKSPRPDVILLDLRMPKVDGQQVLREIKASEALSSIPVVVLTSSDLDTDIDEAYLNHANSYLVKPLGTDEFTQLMDDLGVYWLMWNHGAMGKTLN